MYGRKTRHLGVISPKTWALMRAAFTRRFESAEAPARQAMTAAPWKFELVKVAKVDGERVLRAGFTLGRFAVSEALGYSGWWGVVTAGSTWSADQEGRCLGGRWSACEWAKQIACLLSTCDTLPQMQRVVDLASQFGEPLASIRPAWMRELIEFECPYDGPFGRILPFGAACGVPAARRWPIVGQVNGQTFEQWLGGRWAAMDTCATPGQARYAVELAREYQHPLAAVGPPWMRELASLENPYTGMFGQLRSRGWLTVGSSNRAQAAYEKLSRIPG